MARWIYACSRGRPSRRSIGMIAFIALLHLSGWGTVLALALQQRLGADGAAFVVGVALTAYLLGVRHAFDADHIAAIDNTTRKLLHDGQRPEAVGFWFACGHSSVVFALTLLVAFGSHLVLKRLFDADSALHGVARSIGILVSGGFLYAIAATNLVTLAEIVRRLRRTRAGGGDDDVVSEDGIGQRGITGWLTRPVAKLVHRPWQMFLVGLLFGLGFDTATEIGLLVLTSSSADSGLPWQAVLSLPVLFAAGMSLFDTADGYVMSAAYGWAREKQARRLGYDLVVTGLSISVAIGVGTFELIGLVGDGPRFAGPLWTRVGSLDPSRVGIAIAALFVATWILGIAITRHGRVAARSTRAPVLAIARRIARR